MDIEIRKLRLIEDFIKVRDHKLLDKIEKLLHPKVSSPVNPVEKFAGIWSKEEADEMRKNIEEGCEQINDDDW